MGRFTSVQGFADNNSNNRSITYDQAKGSNANSDDNKKVATEKVVNPYGSTSGAGSGEFHVYRHSRAREMARWNALDEHAKQQKAEQEFKNSLQVDQDQRETKASKNRKKRQREKEAKRRKKVLKAAGIDVQKSAPGSNQDEEEFTYIPVARQRQQEKKSKPAEASVSEPSSEGTFANDGSFLEMMRQKLQEESKNIATATTQETTNETGNSLENEKAKDNTPVEDDESDDEGPALPPPKK